MKTDIFRKCAALFLAFILTFSSFSGTFAVRAEASNHKILEDLTVFSPDGASHNVRTIHYEYKNNRYLSIRDTALAFAGTKKAFEVSVSGSSIEITTGTSYRPAGGEGTPFYPDENAVSEEGTVEDAVPDEAAAELVYSTENLKINPMKIDGRELRYYTFIGKNAAGLQDAFVSLTDLAMLLDAELRMKDDCLYLSDEGGFYVDMESDRGSGLFHEVSSSLVGDAMTGKVFCSYHEDVAVPAASTTKLMTYLCVMDALSSGEIDFSDMVVISEKAEKLSHTSDGVLPVSAGQQIPLKDLLYGILLPSSNESALALAEHIAGSEEAFVERMNRTASSIGLSSATEFINCHGLPEFADSVAASKIQNHISARDMFTLCSYILTMYPQIKDISSTKEYPSEAFGTTLVNTNPILYNLPNAVGLKTGTTKASGVSLVSACDVKMTDGVHTIVAVEYGAEDATIRCTLSELLLRYGMQCLSGEDKGSSEKAGIPDDPEEVIRRLLRSMK